MSVDILGTSWDQCWSMVQYSFMSTETRRLVRTDSPGRPPRLSHSSWTMQRWPKKANWGWGSARKESDLVLTDHLPQQCRLEQDLAVCAVSIVSLVSATSPELQLPTSHRKVNTMHLTLFCQWTEMANTVKSKNNNKKMKRLCVSFPF